MGATLDVYSPVSSGIWAENNPAFAEMTAAEQRAYKSQAYVDAALNPLDTIKYGVQGTIQAWGEVFNGGNAQETETTAPLQASSTTSSPGTPINIPEVISKLKDLVKQLQKLKADKASQDQIDAVLKEIMTLIGALGAAQDIVSKLDVGTLTELINIVKELMKHVPNASKKFLEKFVKTLETFKTENIAAQAKAVKDLFSECKQIFSDPTTLAALQSLIRKAFTSMDWKKIAMWIIGLIGAGAAGKELIVDQIFKADQRQTPSQPSAPTTSPTQTVAPIAIPSDATNASSEDVANLLSALQNAQNKQYLDSNNQSHTFTINGQQLINTTTNQPVISGALRMSYNSVYYNVYIQNGAITH